MERLQWITHKGKKILLINYSNLKSIIPSEKQEILDTIKKARDLAEASKEKIRFLTDATNTSASSDVIQALKDFAAFTSSNNLVDKECVVGISGLQKVFLNTINLFAKSKLELFSTIDQAKDWLVT